MGSGIETAQWIAGEPYAYGQDAAGYYDEVHRNHVVFRRFTASSVQGALLTVAVLGYARVMLNGQRVDGSELLGWWTNPAKTVYVHEVDVTHLVAEGENELVIELGNGFYNPAPLTLFGKYNLRESLAEVGTPRVACSIEADDGRVFVASDASWQVADGQLLFNNVYLGEVRDLRITEAAVERGARPVTVYEGTRSLEPAPVAPCVRAGRVPALSVTEQDDALVIDLGEVVAGFFDLRFKGSEGARVEIEYAETWLDGGPYAGTSVAGYVGMETPRGACPGGPGAPALATQRDAIICRGGENHFENEFCWHSFRYAVVRGIRRADLLEAAGVYVHTDLVMTGSLELGNKAFERLHEAAVRTKLNNNHGVFEDCARERFGYGGDMIALFPSQAFSFDVSGLIDKTLADFRRDQTKRGGMPETAPFMGIGSNGPAYGEGPLLWQMAYPYLAVEADRIFGMHDVLQREWVGIERFGDYLRLFNPEELAVHCLGDHGSMCTGDDFKSGTPDKLFVGWCAILWGFELVTEVARRLGADGKRFEVAADSLRRDIVKRFRANDGSFGDGTQTSWAFAAALGLGDADALVKGLVDAVERADGVLQTGIFGTMFAFDLLSSHGYNEVLERWLLRSEAPSLLSMLASGNGVLIEQFDDPLASCDHAMFSSYDQWFYQGLAGIHVALDARGCDRVSVQPYLSHETDVFGCHWRVPAGELTVTWKRAGALTSLVVQVPASMHVDVRVPAGCKVVQHAEEAGAVTMLLREAR